MTHPDAAKGSKFLTVTGGVRRWLLAGLFGAATVIGLAGGAQAQTLLNGGFETFTAGTGGNRAIAGAGSTMQGWSMVNPTLGYASVITTTQANSASGYLDNGQTIPLWNPNNGGTTTIAASGDGGNFVAFENVGNTCGCYIYQTVTGLTVNARYTVSFMQAGAAWAGGTALATTDFWTVGWGKTTDAYSSYTVQNSATINTPAKGFSGWVTQQLVFVATATQMVLTFMANGSPTGQPPFSLLDGVSVTAVPEPASALLVWSGIAGLVALRRSRKRR